MNGLVRWIESLVIGDAAAAAPSSPLSKSGDDIALDMPYEQQQEEQDAHNRAYIRELRECVELYYGRRLEYKSELYFDMMSYATGERRYWRMTESHPIAEIIEHTARGWRIASPAVTRPRTTLPPSTLLIKEVIYTDDTMHQCIESLARMFEDYDTTLHDSTTMEVSPPPPPKVVDKKAV